MPYDALTGLPNRFHFLELLKTKLAVSQSSQSLAILFIDLDRFQQVNDSLGYEAGDALLRCFAQRLRESASDGDLIGRLSGDEFAVVTGGRLDLWMHSLRSPYSLMDDEWFLTASVGGAIFPIHGVGSKDLLHAAELGMRRAKVNGGDELVILDHADVGRKRGRLKLENDLRHALARNEFQLLYQPVVRVDGSLDAFEVLLTWVHPELGVISPGDFIPLAEETGLIVSIGAWVLQHACFQGMRWRGAGYRQARLSVNVSARQCERRDFLDMVASALALSGLPPRSLELELTESYVMGNLAGSFDRMRQIRELGVRITMDDFGTGYSSLSVLGTLPLDTIKIDQSFIRQLLAPEGSLPVVQSIIRMAHDLRLEIVAEGVETEAELDLVRVLGCDKVQGHVYGPVMSAEDAGEMLARNEENVPLIGARAACR